MSVFLAIRLLFSDGNQRSDAEVFKLVYSIRQGKVNSEIPGPCGSRRVVLDMVYSGE